MELGKLEAEASACSAIRLGKHATITKLASIRRQTNPEMVRSELRVTASGDYSRPKNVHVVHRKERARCPPNLPHSKLSLLPIVAALTTSLLGHLEAHSFLSYLARRGSWQSLGQHHGIFYGSYITYECSQSQYQPRHHRSSKLSVKS